MLRLVGRFHYRKIQEKGRKILELKLYKPIRCYSKDICPPPKKKSSSGALYTLGALALVGGATLGYAKYDPEFRQSLVAVAPFTDTMIQVIFQEDPYDPLGALSGLYLGVKKSIANLVRGGDPESKSKSGDGELVCPPPITKDYKAPLPIMPILEKDLKKPEETYTEIRLNTKDQTDCEIAPDSKLKSTDKSLPKSLVELEERICEAATEAVNAYNKAIYNLQVYNQEISTIIDEAIDHVKPQMWDSIKAKTREKNDSLVEAKEKAEKATKEVNKLKSIISKPDFDAPPSTKEMIKINIEKVQDDIETAKKQFEMERKLGSTTEKYWEKVEKARKHFQDELESLFPSINIDNKKLDISEAELDLFVLHVYSNVMFYQKELAKMDTVVHERLQMALETAKKGGGTILTDAQICEAVDKEKRRLTVCFQQQCLKLRREAEHDLREQLKRQSQVFCDHLDEAVKTRGLEIERELNRKFDEQLETERGRYKLQLAAMVGRLKGLDHALKARDDADKAAKNSQVLWSACQSLLRALQSGCPGIPWKEQLRPLDPEITSVQKAAAKDDELVGCVINGIPKEAKDRGVFPEDALRERFLKVEEVARIMAMLPEDGGALPLYVLSYLQSFFLIKSASPIPASELKDEATDFSQLSTNEILQRARYWLDRGDFEQTLKYMNLLKGAPRSIARQWMNETRILLETQQAANTLMAHAASSGLMYL